MLYRNAELDRAFEFIAKSDFDLFCLQEVPSAMLARLQTLPYHLAYTIDIERVFAPVVQNYLVVLSRYPLTNERTVAFPDYWTLLPLRTRILIHLLRPLHFSRLRNRSGLVVDVALPHRTVHLFNLHLILAHPTFRMQELEKAMTFRVHSTPAIVCGDFNILEARSISILNWLLGGRVSDALFHRRERSLVEERFSTHGLTNVLRGKVTHNFSHSQLDHILVSREFDVLSAEVVVDPYGSDHQPILVETK